MSNDQVRPNSRRMAILYFLLVTFCCATFAMTTNETRTAVLFLKYFSFVILVFSAVGYHAIKFRLPLEPVVAIFLFFAVTAYGLTASTITISITATDGDFAQDILFNTICIYAMSSTLGRSSEKLTFFLILCLGIGITALTIATNGLVLENPPRFDFSSISDAKGADVLYSQGMSKFMGLIAISFIVLSGKTDNFALSTFLKVGCTVFLALSFLGGGRGDSIIAGLMVLVYTALNSRTGLITILAVAVALLAILSQYTYLEETIIYQRLNEVLYGDYGLRDRLISDAVNLLQYEPICAVTGCGFGYFQLYYGYAPEMYPHNLFLELIISLGFPATFSVFVFFMIGIRDHQNRTRSLMDGQLCVSVFFILIGLKSGTYFSSYIFVATFYVLASKGIMLTASALLASKWSEQVQAKSRRASAREQELSCSKN